jgi:hypothetical protein
MNTLKHTWSRHCIGKNFNNAIQSCKMTANFKKISG